MRLYDRLRMFSVDENVPVIDVSAIAEQIDRLEGGPGESGNWPAAAYGVVAPPFGAFFMEATTQAEDGTLVQRGALCAAFEQKGKPKGHVPPGTRWTIIYNAFIWSNDPRLKLSTYAAAGCIFIAADGTLMPQMDDGIQLVAPPGGQPPYPSAIQLLAAEGAAAHAVYLLKGISALHRRVPAEHVRPGRQERRDIERQTGKPATEYYVLKVRPTTPGSFEEVASRPTGGPKRSHHVRGHFRYYPPERPLFGRPGQHGAIWVPEHDRGEDAIGRITKDYQVEAEASDAE